MTIKIFSFWSGSGLGYIERLCLASMLEVGHEVDVYSYNSSLEVPPGVNVKPAEEILPEMPTKLAETRNWATISDIFRYAALKKDAGIWVDLDVLLLRPLDGMGQHIFGWQSANIINNAVLKLPAESPCLDKLIEMSRSRVVVGRHWSFKHKVYQNAMALVGLETPLERMERGVLGPYALTHYARSCDLVHRCQSVDVFYPIDPNDAPAFFLADAERIEDKLTSSTRAVHFWNELIKVWKEKPPPPRSYIAKMCARFAVEFDSPNQKAATETASGPPDR